MGLVEDQVDAMIAQRVDTEGCGLDGITSTLLAAHSILVDLGPVTLNEDDDKQAARAYLTQLVEGA